MISNTIPYRNKSIEERKKEERNIVKETTALSLAMYISQLILGLRGFIIARFLGPNLYGLWSILTTIILAAIHLGLGTSQALVREIPLNVGKNKANENAEIQQNSFTFQIFVSLGICVVLLMLTLTSLINSLKGEIRLLGVVLIFNNTYYFLTKKLTSEKRIYSLAIYIIAYAILNTAIGIFLLFFLKINGLLLGMIISHLSLFVISLKRRHLSINLQLNRSILDRLIKIGFPIMILAMSSLFMQYIDRFLVFTLLGNTMTGYYALASYISVLFHYIPHSMSNVLFPRMMHKYGRTSEKKEIEEYFIQPITILAFGTPILLGLVFINVDIAILYLLPEYIPSLIIIKILVLSLFFSIILRVPIDILILFNKQKTVMFLQIASLVFGGILDYLAIINGYGIEGVAFATAFTYFVVSVVLMIYALHILDKAMPFIIKQLFFIYSPFFYGLFGLFIINSVLNNFPGYIYQSFLMSILYLIISIPLVISLNKYGILGKIFYALRFRG